MLNRRQFLLGVMGTVGAGMVGSAWGCQTKPDRPSALRVTDPRKALVLWYSPTGHTGRLGRLFGKVLEKNGLAVTATELRGFDLARAPEFDLIMIGTPVHYMDIPPTVAEWLRGLPELNNTAVAAWVTFGNKGSNQVNTGWQVVETLMAKGGAPVGMHTFGNMNTYSLSLVGNGAQRTLKHKHLPNEKTYADARQFVGKVLANIRQNRLVTVDHVFDVTGLVVPLRPMWWAKKFLKDHSIDLNKCTQCGTCVRGCPVNAIEATSKAIDRERCVLCCACVNNCPADAVRMSSGSTVAIGFRRFCRENGIVIVEPPELTSAT